MRRSPPAPRSGGCLRRRASPTTRDEWRRSTLAAYQAEQTRLRAMSSRWDGTSKANLTVRAELDGSKLDGLQKENDIMRAGLVAAIRAVGEHGAFRPWRKFFEEY